MPGGRGPRLKLRGAFDGEYISFDLVASLTELQRLLREHLDLHYPGEHVTVTVTLHRIARSRVSRRHEEYVFAPVWEGREWIVWEAPTVGTDQTVRALDAPESASCVPASSRTDSIAAPTGRRAS